MTSSSQMFAALSKSQCSLLAIYRWLAWALDHYTTENEKLLARQEKNLLVPDDWTTLFWALLSQILHFNICMTFNNLLSIVIQTYIFQHSLSLSLQHMCLFSCKREIFSLQMCPLISVHSLKIYSSVLLTAIFFVKRSVLRIWC